ncbi:coq1 putative hexaprenyl diphosphate synthase [Blastocladiella emersonii ATCC 22665]|nr:coq1 putative hexaprenyl diphosphate synthase [Blastocladiella emersonii ATCC 22665]
MLANSIRPALAARRVAGRRLVPALAATGARSRSTAVAPSAAKSTAAGPAATAAATPAPATAAPSASWVGAAAASLSRLFGSLSAASGSAQAAAALPPLSAQASWNQTLAHAEKLVVPPGGKLVDPMEILGQDMASLTANVQKLLTTDSEVLRRMSHYYFNQNGKHIRPLLVLLISLAARTAHPPGTAAPAPSVVPVDAAARQPHTGSFAYMDTPISPVLAHDDVTRGFSATAYDVSASGILPTQRRLAEITEMIHTASLLHDDVIDAAATRRGVPSVNAEHGNKMAILAGDYLLARASLSLARLRHCEVVELLATVIADLVEGEVMQLRNTGSGPTPSWQSPSAVPNPSPAFDHYMEKTYLKTAALIAKSCRAATVLGGAPPAVADVAYTYGKHLGLAFQLVDDLLDFTGSAVTFGKPAGGADLKLGLATAPVLFAAQEYPELQPLIDRRFSEPDDAALAFDLVHASQGLVKTRDWAAVHAQTAAAALGAWPPSPARDALVQLTEKVLTRTK